MHYLLAFGSGGVELLEIRLLGAPEATVDDVPIDVDTRKAIALLAYLAVEGSATRDTLATLFWADSSAERARATLRRTLSSLRSGVESDAIDANRDRITLVAAQTDIESFDSALAETNTHEHPEGDTCPSCIAPLASATDLYRGDFLEGFSVRDAPEFEDWVRTVGESYRLKAGDAFNRLAMSSAAVGDYTGAIAAVSRWIDLDELHEPAHRLLMLLNAWAGDRPGAIEAYRAFVAILDRELGVPPLEETTELYEAILDEDLPPAPGMRRRVKAEPTAVARPTDLVDRLDQLETLRSALAASRNRGMLLMLRGAAWMGKTRLLEELAEEATASGHIVLTGRAFRMEQELPYGVVAQVLSSAARFEPRAHDDIPGWALAEVSRIEPSFARGLQPADQDAFGDLRLLESIRLIVANLSERSPLVLIVDDIQWIDPASAAVVSYITKRIADLPILIVVAHRSDHSLGEVIQDTVATARTIDLPPLTVGDIIDRVEDAEAATAHIRKTGGVPLLVLEELTGDGTSTEGVYRYIDARLAGVTDLARQVLSTAAVLTGICTPTLLRETSGRSEDEIADAVEELIEAGLLHETLGSDGLAFSLDALEKVAYDSLTMIRKRLLHRRAGEALAEAPRSQRDARLAAAAAAQFRGAGDQRAAAWYLLAGDLAREVYANAEARAFYEAAIALGSDDPGHLQLALGDLAMTAGDYSEAAQNLNAAAAQSEGPRLALVEHRLGEVHRLIGRFDMATEHFERSVAMHPRPAEVLADWSLLLHRRGDESGAAELIERAQEAITEADPDSLRSRIHNINGVVAQDAREAMDHLDQALQLAGDDELTRMAALNNMAHLLAGAGDAETAVSLVSEAIEIAVRTGHRHREAALRNHLADLFYRSGKEEESRQAQKQAMELFADIGSDTWEPEVWLLSSW